MLISRCYCFFCFSSSSLMMILNFFFTFKIKNECIYDDRRLFGWYFGTLYNNIISENILFVSLQMKCVYIHMVHTLEYSPNMGLLVLFCFFFCCVNANFTIDQKMNESLRQVIIGLPLCDVCMMCKCVRIRFPRVKMFPYRMKCRVKKKEQRRNTLNNVKT